MEKQREKTTTNWQACPDKDYFIKSNRIVFLFFFFWVSLLIQTSDLFSGESTSSILRFSQHRRKGTPKRRLFQETLRNSGLRHGFFSLLLILSLLRSVSLPNWLSCFWPYVTLGLMEMLCLPSSHNSAASVAFL